MTGPRAASPPPTTRHRARHPFAGALPSLAHSLTGALPGAYAGREGGREGGLGGCRRSGTALPAAAYPARAPRLLYPPSPCTTPCRPCWGCCQKGVVHAAALGVHVGVGVGGPSLGTSAFMHCTRRHHLPQHAPRFRASVCCCAGRPACSHPHLLPRPAPPHPTCMLEPAPRPAVTLGRGRPLITGHMAPKTVRAAGARVEGVMLGAANDYQPSATTQLLSGGGG